MFDFENAIVDDVPTAEIIPSAVPKRTSSSRRHTSTYGGSSHADDKEHPIGKLLDLKGESIVKSPFLMGKSPQTKEVEKKPPQSRKPIMERARFSLDGEKPRFMEENNEREREREHKHRHRTREEKEREREREWGESPKDRKIRRESAAKMEIVRREEAEAARRDQERDEENRRIKREERRRRREEREAAERGDLPASTTTGPESPVLSPREREVRREREHRHHHRRVKERFEEERMKEKKKNPMVNLWTNVKKVFDKNQ